MARRRLNTKVALIGTAVLVALAATTVVVVFSGGPDPAQLIAAGDAAMAARDYESARLNYTDAFGASDSPEQKVDLLFKLSDVYQATGDWRRVLGCWEQVITSDPQNLPARLGRLKYAYILADSLSEFGQSVDNYWKDVASQATELIEAAEGTGVLEQDKAQWEPSFGVSEQPGWDSGIRLVGPYLYFVKGRAAFELAGMGAVAAPAQMLEQAKEDLGKSLELDPGNAAAYRYLAAVYFQIGENAASRGSQDERTAALGAAATILAQGVAAAPDAPNAHVNGLVRKLTLAQSGPIAEMREKMRALEPEYEALAERFADSAEALAAQAEFYSFYAACLDLNEGRDKLDRAIEAAQKAVALDPATIKYARFAATLHYRKSSAYDDEAALGKAMELAKSALARPQSQDTPGPRHYAVLAERLSLNALVATCSVEGVLALPPGAGVRNGLLAQAEGAVHEIQQIQGSADNPQVVKWQGMLELARGNEDSAVRSLYGAYGQTKAASGAGEVDAYLADTLAGIVAGTPEVGAAIEFLESALNCGIATTRPEALLDYGRVLLQAGLYEPALNAVNSFDERFGATLRSRQVRIRTLIAGGHLSEAREHLAALAPTDPNTLRLQLSLIGAQAAQLQEAIQRARSGVVGGDAESNAQPAGEAMKAELLGYRMRQARIAGQLWRQDIAVSDEEHMAQLCETLIDANEMDPARELVAAFVDRLPNSAIALFYQAVLSEPDPAACSVARLQEIRLQAAGRVQDPVARSMALAAYYQGNDRLDEAVAEWREVLSATAAVTTDDEQLGFRRTAAGRLFDIACYRENWALAEEIVRTAKTDNLDGCQGHVYAGRLAFARDRQTEALAELDECLKLRPIFSYGYMLRGNIQAAAGNERAAISDLQRALELNPIDPVTAKALASALLVRNRRLASNASEAQRTEARRALEHAIRLNPRDTQVLLAFADLIGDSEPLKALALRQTIQANAPSLNNAVMLGRLATSAALKETDEARKAALFAMAENAFEQARRSDPDSALVLESYAEYYRARGQNDRARQLLVESQDERLLWRHYYRIGRYEEAQQLLEKMLYDPNGQADALKGLVWVAQATRDKDAIKTYAERLLSIEDNATNRLAQIRAYLDAGLVQDAKYRLQSFKDRYSGDARIGLLEALLAKRQGQVKRALELANRNLERNQQDPAAWRLRGDICLLSGATDQAITSLERSGALEDNPATRVTLARAYLQAGRDNDAIGELTAALEAPAPPAEARSLLESIYRRLGRDDALEQLYADTLKELPNSVRWLTHAGAFALGRHQYERAAAWYEQALRVRQEQLAPTTPTVRDAQYVVALDGYLQALVLGAEALDQVVQEGGRYLDTPYAALVLPRMAQARKAQGDLAAARDYGHQAIDRALTDDTLAGEVLLRVSAVLGEEEVANHCRQRLNADPQSVAANLLMAHLAQGRKDYDGAVDYIDKCIALSGAQDQPRTDYQLRKASLLTAAYRETSDKSYLGRAIDVYESLAEQMPTNSSVLNNLAFLLAQADRDLVRALEYARKVLATDPDSGAYLDTYAYVLHQNGRNAEAVEAALAAVQQYEVNGVEPTAAYEHLGMIREALGEN